MGTSIKKLLRQLEAELRYHLFLHQLELQKIEAVGNANAKLADAIVRARQRLIVLERHVQAPCHQSEPTMRPCVGPGRFASVRRTMLCATMLTSTGCATLRATLGGYATGPDG